MSHQFLRHFGIIANNKNEKNSAQHYMKVYYLYKKETHDFEFSKPYKTFDVVAGDEEIAKDGDKRVKALYPGYIIFPTTKNPIGGEAFILAEASSV